MNGTDAQRPLFRSDGSRSRQRVRPTSAFESPHNSVITPSQTNSNTPVGLQPRYSMSRMNVLTAPHGTAVTPVPPTAAPTPATIASPVHRPPPWKGPGPKNVAPTSEPQLVYRVMASSLDKADFTAQLKEGMIDFSGMISKHVGLTDHLMRSGTSVLDKLSAKYGGRSARASVAPTEVVEQLVDEEERVYRMVPAVEDGDPFVMVEGPVELRELEREDEEAVERVESGYVWGKKDDDDDDDDTSPVQQTPTVKASPAPTPAPKPAPKPAPEKTPTRPAAQPASTPAGPTPAHPVRKENRTARKSAPPPARTEPKEDLEVVELSPSPMSPALVTIGDVVRADPGAVTIISSESSQGSQPRTRSTTRSQPSQPAPVPGKRKAGSGLDLSGCETLEEVCVALKGFLTDGRVGADDAVEVQGCQTRLDRSVTIVKNAGYTTEDLRQHAGSPERYLQNKCGNVIRNYERLLQNATTAAKAANIPVVLPSASSFIRHLLTLPGVHGDEVLMPMMEAFLLAHCQVRAIDLYSEEVLRPWVTAIVNDIARGAAVPASPNPGSWFPVTHGSWSERFSGAQLDRLTIAADLTKRRFRIATRAGLAMPSSVHDVTREMIVPVNRHVNKMVMSMVMPDMAPEVQEAICRFRGYVELLFEKSVLSDVEDRIGPANVAHSINKAPSENDAGARKIMEVVLREMLR